MTQLLRGLTIRTMLAATPAPKTGQVTARVPVLALLAATVLVFSASLAAPFHLDDLTLFDNPVATSPWGWWYVWRPLQTRPLTYFTFWLNYQAGGQNPVGYHALNVLLHVFAAWLLYRLVRRMAGETSALIAMGLFALHPIQVEPVAYIFERATVLAAVFCLLSSLAWLDGHYRRAAGFFILALLSKEECVTFPLFLLLLRPAIAPVISMLGLSLIAGVRVLVALERLQISGAGLKAGISPLDYFSTQGLVVLRYFRLMLVPYGFTCDPDIPIVRDWRAWIAWAAIVAIAAFLWKFHRHGKWLVAGLILLAPSSSIFPAEDLAADRRVYLPMIAWAVYGGLSLQRVNRRTILVPAALGLAVLSSLRVQVWRSEQRLWAEAAERGPAKLRPLISLARLSDTPTAMGILDRAQALAPKDPRPIVERGLQFMALGLPDRALEQFEAALALAPDDPTTLNNHGVALSAMGKRDAAIRQFRHALRVAPCSATARKNLALLGVSDDLACP